MTSNLDPIVGLSHRLALAETQVLRLYPQLAGLADTYQFNCAHGYFSERARMKQDLDDLSNTIKLWRDRYNDSAMQVVRYADRCHGGNRADGDVALSLKERWGDHCLRNWFL